MSLRLNILFWPFWMLIHFSRTILLFQIISSLDYVPERWLLITTALRITLIVSHFSTFFCLKHLYSIFIYFIALIILDCCGIYWLLLISYNNWCKRSLLSYLTLWIFKIKSIFWLKLIYFWKIHAFLSLMGLRCSSILQIR